MVRKLILRMKELQHTERRYQLLKRVVAGRMQPSVLHDLVRTAYCYPLTAVERMIDQAIDTELSK